MSDILTVRVCPSCGTFRDPDVRADCWCVLALLDDLRTAPSVTFPASRSQQVAADAMGITAGAP